MNRRLFLRRLSSGLIAATFFPEEMLDFRGRSQILVPSLPINVVSMHISDGDRFARALLSSAPDTVMTLLALLAQGSTDGAQWRTIARFPIGREGSAEPERTVVRQGRTVFIREVKP